MSRTGRGLFLFSLDCVFFQLSGPRELSIYEGSPGSAGRMIESGGAALLFSLWFGQGAGVVGEDGAMLGAARYGRCCEGGAGWYAPSSEAASSCGWMVRALVGGGRQAAGWMVRAVGGGGVRPRLDGTRRRWDGGIRPRASSPPFHSLPVHRDSDRCIDLQVPRFFRCPSPQR